MVAHRIAPKNGQRIHANVRVRCRRNLLDGERGVLVSEPGAVAACHPQDARAVVLS